MVVRHIGLATLIEGDWRDYAGWPDDGVVLTDPPYGIAFPTDIASRRPARDRWWIAGRRTRRISSHTRRDYPPIVEDDKPFEPSEVLQLGSARLLWGANHYASRLPDSGGWIVWDKMRPPTLDQSTCELAWTDFVKGVRQFRHLWNGLAVDSERNERYHPMQKPVALWNYVLGLKWTPDSVVLDPYMGAGGCGVAAVNAGRRYIGAEIIPHYYDVACERIERAQRQSRLFP